MLTCIKNKSNFPNCILVQTMPLFFKPVHAPMEGQVILHITLNWAEIDIAAHAKAESRVVGVSNHPSSQTILVSDQNTGRRAVNSTVSTFHQAAIDAGDDR
jgi:hypothetical protein